MFILEIINLTISPQRKGLGSKIFNTLVEEISIIETLEKIILYPKNELAKNFWIKNGFREMTLTEINDNKSIYGFKTLIYDIK